MNTEGFKNFLLLALNKILHYLKVYWDWLNKYINSDNDFTILALALLAIFMIGVYAWYRNRDA